MKGATFAAILVVAVACTNNVRPQSNSANHLAVLEYRGAWEGSWRLAVLEEAEGGRVVLEEGETTRSWKLSREKLRYIWELFEDSGFDRLESSFPSALDDAPTIILATGPAWGSHSVAVEGAWIRECSPDLIKIGKLWTALLHQIGGRLECEGDGCSFCQ